MPANHFVTVHTGHIDNGANDYFRYYADGDARNGAGVAILQSMPWWGDADLAEEWALKSHYVSPNLNLDGPTGGDEEQVAFAYDFYLPTATRYLTKRKPDDYHNYDRVDGEVHANWSGGYAVDYSTFSGITLNRTGTRNGTNLLTTEAGGSSTFTIVLDTAPTANVTVSITGLRTQEGSLDTDTLTFTTANWDTPQTVTVTGVDDAFANGDYTYSLIATASNTGGYAGTERAATNVTNIDDDTNGVTITQTGTTDGADLLTTEAGGSSTFTVVLNAAPTADVTVSITGNDATEHSLSTNTLTFTAANWDTAQTITVTGVNEDIDDGDITTTLTATANNAGGYAGTESDTTTVKNTDNDTNGVTITQTGTTDGADLLTTEAGGTSTFTVVLDAEPTADVTVSITGNDATENSLSTDTLTFTTANWNTAQTVTVTGVDDTNIDGDITNTLTATANNAGGYAGTESDTTTVKNTDDDTVTRTIDTVDQTGSSEGTTTSTTQSSTTESENTTEFLLEIPEEEEFSAAPVLTPLIAAEPAPGTEFTPLFQTETIDPEIDPYLLPRSNDGVGSGLNIFGVFLSILMDPAESMRAFLDEVLNLKANSDGEDAEIADEAAEPDEQPTQAQQPANPTIEETADVPLIEFPTRAESDDFLLRPDASSQIAWGLNSSTPSFLDSFTAQLNSSATQPTSLIDIPSSIGTGVIPSQEPSFSSGF